jgi:hypothetical protein
MNPDNKVKHQRKSLAFIVRTHNVKAEDFIRQVNLLGNYYDVDIYSFYRIPAIMKYTQFPPGTGVQNFPAFIPKGKYELAYLYLDDNANSYTMQENLKKLGIKTLSKTVIREEAPKKEEKEEKENDKATDATRQSFVL